MEKYITMDENKLYKLLNDLRKSKQKGELDTEEKLTQQSVKWRNTLEYSVLVMCSKHYSDKCRMEMLALLVESKKSTLRFTITELHLILIFLINNLCEKMEYMPLIKKALKRLKDSQVVIQRQFLQALKKKECYKEQNFISEMYEDAMVVAYKECEQIEWNIRNYTHFILSLRLLCVINLYPEATYDRKRSCLQILLLMQNLLPEFRNFKWKKDEVEMIFHCLLMDTYEPNKEMAYQIINSVSPELLSLDSKSWVHSIIEAAFELGSSIRPIDSVTAAYMLKIAKLSPVIKNIFCNYYNVEDKVTEAITLQLILLLYEKLQEVLSLAKENLGIAINKNSIYGYLFCIRSLLSDCDLGGTETSELWQNTIADIIVLCFELNHTVSVVVNNSSPEGHLPMDLKTLNLDASFPKKEIITPQMALLCSWRTVKEVSLLFGLLATKASIQTVESQNGLLTIEQIENIMKHLVSLLCETKHRGAFEQAYVGFHQLCTRLWRLTDKSLNRIPMFWLYTILMYFTGFASGYVLCSTRRSAGIPFMIQAVLSSEPKIKNNSETFASWIMKILLQFAQIKCTVSLHQSMMDVMYGHPVFSKHEFLLLFEQIEEKCKEMTDRDLVEIKIHSMNILRALFRHSQLGDITKNYIMDALIVACRNYESIRWSERNAATLLFSTLIIRIFGVQRTKDHINLTTDNKMTARIFFERYPNLFDFILHELQTASGKEKSMIRSNVQVILLLLSRLYINCHFDTDIAWINEIVNLVSECGKSPVYKTRELAARALVPLLTDSTAYNFLKKLFASLCTARHTQISTNLTHGYLLQILEILMRLPSVRLQLLKFDITNFIRATDWILKGLEKRANVFSCFPIASVYIDVLHSLDKNVIESCDIEDILHILQQHLVEKDLLKQGPGEYMYKVSAIKFILHMGNSKFLQTVHNGRSTAFNIYSRLLIIPEAEIQSIAWTTVFKVIKSESYQQGKLLSTYALRVVADFTDDLYKYNPKLQDAIFDFLYNSLMDINDCCVIDKREICNLVLKKLYLNDANNIYFQRANYLRLLGKCMTLTHELKDKELRMEHIKDIYRKICDNRWIGLLDTDFRLSVFDILYELFEKDIDIEHCNPVLDWWTMLLQLLVDDNTNVRVDASEVICRLEPCNKLECFEQILLVFFYKFKKIVADKYPEIAVSALFCWSVSLLGDINYEMDESDVFNKCRNYSIFDPMEISELCFNLMKSITQQYSIDNALPPDAVRWINYRLDIDFPALSSFKQIVYKYQNSLPTVGKMSKEVMDPTFRDKAFQSFTCERYMSL